MTYDPRQNQQPVTPPQWGQGAPGQWAGSAPPPQPQYQPGPPPYGYQQPYGPPQPPPRKSRKGPWAIGCLGLFGLVVLIGALAGSHSSSSSSAPVTPLQTAAAVPPVHSAAAAKAPAAQTVTYQVEGSAADVTYGPAGSNFSGSVPLNVTQPLASPLYYAITAQLQGSGSVSCRILVDGKVVSQSTASGGYNIADCEISQGFTGSWHSTMGS